MKNEREFERNEGLRMAQCEYCDGKLEYVALPKTIELGKKSRDIAVVRICQKCGATHESDAEKAGIPFLDDLRKMKGTQ
jgi:DNA-directed RNA polymerase subunit RPC12/RpoP